MPSSKLSSTPRALLYLYILMVRRPWVGQLIFYYITLFSSGLPFDLTYYNSHSAHFAKPLQYQYPQNCELLSPNPLRGGPATQQAPNINTMTRPQSLGWCGDLHSEIIQRILCFTDVDHTFLHCVLYQMCATF